MFELLLFIVMTFIACCKITWDMNADKFEMEHYNILQKSVVSVILLVTYVTDLIRSKLPRYKKLIDASKNDAYAILLDEQISVFQRDILQQFVEVSEDRQKPVIDVMINWLMEDDTILIKCKCDLITQPFLGDTEISIKGILNKIEKSYAFTCWVKKHHVRDQLFIIKTLMAYDKIIDLNIELRYSILDEVVAECNRLDNSAKHSRFNSVSNWFNKPHMENDK